MSQPKVMAMLLTANRPELTRRAVECFRAQSYENRRLMIYDTGKPVHHVQEGNIFYEHHPEDAGLTIGALRNLAMAYAHPLCLNADIIVHFDSDDWSHPNRIAEQVALLQVSGADCVGYNELLFWRMVSTPRTRPDLQHDPKGEAWLYSNPRPNYALGTSLCYWRTTWEAKPFEDIPKPGDMEGEDGRFLRGLNVCGVCGLGSISLPSGLSATTMGEPRLIARIHSGNTSDQYRAIAQSGNWKRVPEWDQRMREIMR